MLEKTEYFYDFLDYYERAKLLNERNIGLRDQESKTGDPLQDNVTIYDTVWRRYAGFSKVLEQLWYGPESWTQRKSAVALKDKIGMQEWLYLCLVHRLTGSGASFERDHGYRNSLIIDMVESGPLDIDYWTNYISEYDKPFFTSKGNQIPPFNKPSEGWDKGGREFICEYAPKFAEYAEEVMGSNATDKQTIQSMVDKMLYWLRSNGFKQYKFIVTAWVMDMAEYYPEFVDQDSHCYMGKNAMRSLDLMYTSKDIPKKKFYDIALDDLCETLNNKPYNLEDVLCDSVRYWANYVPKNYEDTYESTSTVPRISLN